MFLALVGLVIWAYFRDGKMSAAALIALGHDLVLTIGIYALVGFTVTPATLIGVLTILGYSLYDTVVVFDKVRENIRDIKSSTTKTYSEAANLAVNQVLVRSINTTVIGVLPVAALLFAGAVILGEGPLKDLALALFVGMISGAYSSIFIATPLLAQLKEREPEMKKLAARVAARRAKEPRSRGRRRSPAAAAAVVESARARRRSRRRAGRARRGAVDDAVLEPRPPRASEIRSAASSTERPRPSDRSATARPNARSRSTNPAASERSSPVARRRLAGASGARAMAGPGPGRTTRWSACRLGQSSPAVELLRRALLAGLFLAIVVVLVWFDRDSYTDSPDGTVSLIDAIYYATVTISTTGYGDITPVAPHARILNAIVVTPLRIAFLVLLVGPPWRSSPTRAGGYRDRRWRKRMRNHVVVVGYGTKGRSAVETLESTAPTRRRSWSSTAGRGDHRCQPEGVRRHRGRRDPS